MVGKPAAAVVSAAIAMKRRQLGALDFYVNPRSVDPSSRPDFMFVQALGGQVACGGEGKVSCACR